MSPTEFEALRLAVCVARTRQPQSVKELRELLALLLPDRSADIEVALHYWALQLRLQVRDE